MKNISEYCESNQDFRQILEKFTNYYIAAYNKRRVAARNEIKKFMNCNFNTWYYSDAPTCYLSPARFINSDIYNKFGSDTVVFPVCRPVYKKDKLINITYVFPAFTLDDHPFIRDLNLFIRAILNISPELQLNEGIDPLSNYIYNNFLDIEKYADFTFKERPYVATLGEVCMRLSLLTIFEGNLRVLPDEKKIKAFFALSGRDKLERIIGVLVERFLQCFDEIGLPDKRPDAEDVLALLEESQNVESFMENLFGDIYHSLSEYANSLIDDPRDHDTVIESLESMDEARLREFAEANAVIKVCCACFYTPFGQYLQLIQPEYTNEFEFMQTDEHYLEILKVNDDSQDDPGFKDQIGSMLYFLQPEGYSLTALGAGRLNINLSQVDDERYPLITEEEYQEALIALLDEGSDEEMPDWLEDILEDPEKLFSEHTDMIQNNILPFKQYKAPDPLEGLNPDNLPVFTDEDATYVFKVKRRTITLTGTQTLADLSFFIQVEFNLNENNMSSFYMGTKFFENEREIRCPRLCIFGDMDEPTDAENYKIHQLNLYEKQKFLYLHNFIHENRFTVTFAGILKE